MNKIDPIKNGLYIRCDFNIIFLKITLFLETV